MVLYQTDEIDYLISGMEKAKDNHYHAITSILNELYTSSSSTFPRRTKATQAGDGNERQAAISQPHLVLFGTAIPRYYYTAVGDRLLRNGFWTRTIAIEADPRGKGRSMEPQPVPERLVDEVKFWVNNRPPNGDVLWEANPTPAVVQATQAAWDAMRACQESVDRNWSIAEASRGCRGRGHLVTSV